jgi:YidC/Oxa1 family membrane protein insertase
VSQQQRMLLAIGLAFGLTLVYSKFKLEPEALEAKRKADEAAMLADAGSLDGGALALAPVVSGDGGATVVAAPLADGGTPGNEMAMLPDIAAKNIEVHRPSTDFVFQNVGGGLSKAVLLEKKEREQAQVSIGEGYSRLVGGKLPPPPQVDLARPVSGQPLPFAVSIEGANPLPADTRWQVESQGDGLLVLKAIHSPWEVTRTFKWKSEGYELSTKVEVKNTSANNLGAELGFHVSRAIETGTEQKGSMFGAISTESAPNCYVDTKVQRKPPTDKGPEEFKGPIHFFGVDQQYFLAAAFPVGGPRDGRCVLTSNATARIADAYFPFAVPAGQSVTIDFGGFLGPKDLALLKSVRGDTIEAAAVAGPELEKSVDFGVFEILCRVLLPTLKFFHGWVGNWGLAIILLTVSVKLILLPLTHRAMVSAEAMKKLQPQLDAIRKKYPDDRERQGTETMKLYQEAKVNPLGGCLPILLQLPVWGALFNVLRSSYELYGEPFINPVWTDLTYKDPTYILPLALGVTMVITQRLQPQALDATQQKIMTWFMPIFFTVIMLNYPAGLALYIFTNNLLSIAQQFLLRRWLARKKAATT